MFYNGEHVCTAVTMHDLDSSAVEHGVRSRKKVRQTFLSTTKAAQEMRAERQRARLSEDEDFTDDELPSQPTHGQTPWTGQQPEDKAPQPTGDGGQAVGSGGRGPSGKRKDTRAPVHYPASAADHAALDDILRHRNDEEFE